MWSTKTNEMQLNILELTYVHTVYDDDKSESFGGLDGALLEVKD